MGGLPLGKHWTSQPPLSALHVPPPSLRKRRCENLLAFLSRVPLSHQLSLLKRVKYAACISQPGTGEHIKPSLNEIPISCLPLLHFQKKGVSEKPAWKFIGSRSVTRTPLACPLFRFPSSLRLLPGVICLETYHAFMDSSQP